jgi:hypothetical protein
MHLVRTTYIEAFVTSVVLEDSEVMSMVSTWELEKPMIIQGLLDHFYGIGLYHVHPSPHAEAVREELISALKTSRIIKEMREHVQAEIAKARERNRGKL